VRVTSKSNSTIILLESCSVLPKLSMEFIIQNGSKC
jgi:hypothetical protein